MRRAPTNGALGASIPAVLANITSGTYSPTFTAVTNLDSTPTVIGSWRYMRVGNVVFVAGACTVDPTASGSLTFDISLPIASAFTTADQASGSTSTTGSSGSGLVFSEATNDRAEAVMASNTSSAAYGVRVQFSYVVL